MLRDLLSIIYPEKCSGCQQVLVKGEKYICLECRNDLPRSFDYKKESPEIEDKLAGRTEILFLYSYLKFRKSGIVQSILHDLKYENKKGLGVMLGEWFGRDLNEGKIQTSANTILVPVPLHKKKIAERGYNQSECIAQGLSHSLSVEMRIDLISRQRYTKTQTHKSREERWENVKDSFRVTNQSDLDGKEVILVDDVLTTGATIEACSELLLENGASSVGVLVLAEAI